MIFNIPVIDDFFYKRFVNLLQDKVTSLQIVVATTSSKMVAFTEMFQTVDEQLRDMWSVSPIKTR